MRKYLLLPVSILLLITVTNKITAQSTHITGPAGSGQFGTTVTVLTNGNYVITDQLYDDGAIADVGAVYLYNGSTHALISILKGSIVNDRVGFGGVTALSSGNFIVSSPLWDNGAAINAGAVTWGNGSTGVSGIVSSSNSLVGGTSNDAIGNNGITVLSNGNYVVRSDNWDNGAITDAGAVTWCNGSSGRTGVVSSSNSLVGSTANDNVGSGGVTGLSNGNYVVRSGNWDNGAATDAGAITWGNGATGRTGVVSSSNSLVGSTAVDQVGINGIFALTSGNYVVSSGNWDNGAVVNAGAVTWGNGSTGISGIVSSSNSLVGNKASDRVGSGSIAALTNGNYVVQSFTWGSGAFPSAGAVTWGNGSTGVVGVVSSSNSLVGSTSFDGVGNVVALSNGNYVVRSWGWDNGGVTDVGAVTWCNGVVGRTGVVSSSNSLVGSIANDNVGSGGVTALSNGNYVVSSYDWGNGPATRAGALTWGNGSTGVVGVVSSSNSLVGSKADDIIGYQVTALSNGNYVASSSIWDNGAVVNAGAVTWGNGTTGISGIVSSSNSLVGSTASDRVGNGQIIALTNGNYVVSSSGWGNGLAINAGAVTWCNGTTGRTGVVSSSNSLVGSTTNDNVGSAVIALSNGNFVVRSQNWNNGAITYAGAVTWGNGSTGVVGVVSSSNSLVGSTVSDAVGNPGVTALSNGNYVVSSNSWDNGAVVNVGAVTWGNGSTGISGIVSSSNSLIGSTANDNVGSTVVTALSNGNYVVRSQNWNNGPAIRAGSVTWGNGSTGLSGIVSSSNSLVGGTSNDVIGNNGITVLSNSNYLVRSNNWDNGAITDAGAVTWGNGSIGVFGVITACNSVMGTAASGGSLFVQVYHSTNDYLIVGRPLDNIATIFNPSGMSMSLANSLDAVAININGTSTMPLIANSDCRIIATLNPNGASPVSGMLNAKAWIEPSVPTYGGKPFVTRHYEITPVTNPSTSTGRVTLYFTQQEFTDFNAHPGSIDDLPAHPGDAIGKSNLKIAKYSGGTNNGTGLPGSYSGGTTIIDPVDADIIWNSSLNRWEVSFDVTGFSGFIVQTNATVLPLTLLDFNGRLVNSNAVLNWKTENEQNTSHFEIEKSIDGRNYTVVGTVSSANQFGVHQYNYTDNNVTTLGASILYYRLKQIDIDNRFSYSRIVALSIHTTKNNVMFYPNPVINEATVSISTTKSGLVQVRIIDNIGRVVKQQQINVIVGSSTHSIEVSSLAKGMYYLELKGENINEQKQFVKQ